MKNFINKFLNRKSLIDLDNDGKIESIRDEVAGVFSQFKDMRDKLVDANNKLSDIAEDEKKKKEESDARIKSVVETETRKKQLADKRIEKVEAERQANERLKENLDNFIM